MSEASNDPASGARAGKRGGLLRSIPLDWLRSPEWGLLIGILLILRLIYQLESTHAFFGTYSVRTLVHNIALFGILSLGAAIVIIAGGIDLSVGAVVAITGVISAKLLTAWLPGLPRPGEALPIHLVAAAVAITLGVGLLIGLFHALMINQFRLPPFIATLATMAGLRSGAILLSGNRSINITSPTFRLLGSDNRYTVPVFVAVAVAASIMMGWTVLGRHLYALGGNETAARLSGLKTNRLKAVAYGLSGMLSALGGLLFTGNTGQAQGTMGVSYELYAITAAGRGRVQPVGRGRLDPGDGAGPDPDPDRDQGDRHRGPRGRQHADRGARARHGRRARGRLQPAVPTPGLIPAGPRPLR